jgi:hypothetical protein
MVREYPTFKWFEQYIWVKDFKKEPSTDELVSWVNIETSWFKEMLTETEIKVSKYI